MTWLTGDLIDVGWLTGAVNVSDTVKKIIIQSPNVVVDIYGQPYTHTYDYWFLTDSVIDIANYNGQAISVLDKGTQLQVVNGQCEVTLSFAVVGEMYTLVAFDGDSSNYFRYVGTVVEV